MKMGNRNHHIGIVWLAVCTTLLLASCSSTRNIPDGDQLYIGLKKIAYQDSVRDAHFFSTQEEVEAALATAPNGALFGSSYYRTPFPYRLWIWNVFSKSNSTFGKWITKSFGKAPVLMSWVNPELRTSVATELLRSHGYFRAQVTHKEETLKNPKKAKIAYTVNMGHLFTIDTLQYVGFPVAADSLIQATSSQAQLHTGDAFDVSALDAERTRVSNLFRNHGYYYYQPGYASYLGDTLAVPGKVQLRMQLADNVPERAKHKWTIGRVDLRLGKRMMETLNDSLRRRDITVWFNGKRPPIRPFMILKDLRLRPRQVYSYDDYVLSANKLAETNLFSMVNFRFTPRDSTDNCDTLDLSLNCVLDRPYDFYIEANTIGKTTGAFGPGVTLGLTKRNAFRGGEKLDINLKGSYEWQTGHHADGTSSRFNSYEYGADVSLEMPRLLLPFKLRRRWYSTPTTIIKASSDVINRSKYFKRHIVSGELTYHFQPTATSVHEFSPLILKYEYMTSQTDSFRTIVNQSPYLMTAMADQFVPKMRYTYAYASPTELSNPIYFQVSVSEAANLLSLGYVAAGKKWGEKGKEMFKNPYAQFLKLEATLRKTWQVSLHSQLVGHVSGGVVWAYGNSSSAPYSEQFYVGGANSVRAFNVRSIGPGRYRSSGRSWSYIDQTGDMKLQANFEFRPHLFGNLYGALFLDAGNVWTLRHDDYRDGSQFQLKDFLKTTALGTGVGLRYDLEFLVLRLDWGVALHAPYDNGFYNISSFRDGQCIHFAIGYPF